MSPSVESLLGYPPSYLLGDFRRLSNILDEDGRSAIARALRGEHSLERFDLRFRHANGSIVIGETRATLVRGGAQGVSRDVTELRRLQENLATLAERDPLTGLANRRLFDELIEEEVARAQRSSAPLAVAFIDLDGLKGINDNHGHDAGDLVLRETAHRLSSLVRRTDVVARLGGDEFVVVYQPNDPSSSNLIKRIDECLSAPISLTLGCSVSCPASIGNADSRTVGYNAIALLAAADVAMYEAKRERRASRAE